MSYIYTIKGTVIDHKFAMPKDGPRPSSSMDYLHYLMLKRNLILRVQVDWACLEALEHAFDASIMVINLNLNKILHKQELRQTVEEQVQIFPIGSRLMIRSLDKSYGKKKIQSIIPEQQVTQFTPKQTDNVIDIKAEEIRPTTHQLTK